MPHVHADRAGGKADVAVVELEAGGDDLPIIRRVAMIQLGRDVVRGPLAVEWWGKRHLDDLNRPNERRVLGLGERLPALQGAGDELRIGGRDRVGGRGGGAWGHRRRRHHGAHHRHRHEHEADPER